MAMAFDGLSSGLDTTALINATLGIQRKPAMILEARVKTNKDITTIWKDLKLNVSSLKTAATNMRSIGGEFMPVKATASDDSVKASATSSASVGEITFRVDSAASKHTVVTAGAFERDAVATDADTSINFTVDGKNKAITVNKGTTLEGLASKINESDIGVKASLINTGKGFKLQLSSKESGAESAFTADLSSLGGLKGADGNPQTDLQVLAAGADAKITVGAGTAAEFTATSKTNTFNNVLKGVSFTIGKESMGKTVTVEAQDDPGALSAKADKLVSAINTIFGVIDSKSSGISTYDDKGNAKDKAGVLKGNALARDIRNGLMRQLTDVRDSKGNPVSLTSVGIEIQKDGTFKFDKTKFEEAAKKDPDKIEALFRGDGSPDDKTSLTARLRTFADDLVDPTKGRITTAVTSIEQQNKQFTNQIKDIDDRIEIRRAAMVKQYASFETKLGELKKQQSMLMGQLGQLAH